MVGPPGSGKSMLAQRFAGLLPPMTRGRSAAKRRRSPAWPASSRSSAGACGRPAARTTRPAPWRWSAAARRRARARSRWRTTACCSSTNCRSFRARRSKRCASRWRPGSITISRAARRAEFPARFQLVGGDEPLPVRLAGLARTRPAAARPTRSRATRASLSGPLLDRIDLHVEVPAMPAEQLLGRARRRTDRRDPRRAARRRAIARSQRQGKANQALQGKEIDPHAALDDAAAQVPEHRRRAPGLERALDAPGAEGGPHHRRPGRGGDDCRSRMWPRRCSTGGRWQRAAVLARKLMGTKK